VDGPGHRLRRLARHRLAPLVLVAVLAMLTVRTCQSESVEATVELRFGDAAEQVREVRGELLRPEETEAVGYFARPYGEAGAPGPLRWTLQASPGSYVLELEVDREGEWIPIERRIELSDRARITVDLERDLKRDPVR
jgi:hypothetical protein